MSTPRKRTRTMSQTTSKRTKPSAMQATPEIKNAIKRSVFALSVGPGRIQNLNYFLSEGVQRYRQIGTKIFLKSMYFRMQLNLNHNGVNAGYNAALVRIIVLKTNQVITQTQAAVTRSQIFRGDGDATNSDVVASHLDLDKNTILYDKVHKLDESPVNANHGTTKSVVFSLPIRKVEHLTADNTGTFKAGQYYMIICYDKPGDTGLAGSLEAYVQHSLSFTDS